MLDTPFSVDELDILRRYGREFERVINGVRAPTIAAQEQFVDAARGRRPPETVYERVWTKYLMRVDWERDPANRAAMGHGVACQTTGRTGNACAERLGAVSEDERRGWTSRIDNRGPKANRDLGPPEAIECCRGGRKPSTR